MGIAEESLENSVLGICNKNNQVPSGGKDGYIFSCAWYWVVEYHISWRDLIEFGIQLSSLIYYYFL